MFSSVEPRVVRIGHCALIKTVSYIAFAVPPTNRTAHFRNQYHAGYIVAIGSAPQHDDRL